MWNCQRDREGTSGSLIIPVGFITRCLRRRRRPDRSRIINNCMIHTWKRTHLGRRAGGGTGRVCRLDPAGELFVLPQLGLCQTPISGLPHGSLDPAPACRGVPDSPGRPTFAHQCATTARSRVAILLKVDAPDVDLLGPLP